MSLRTGPLAVAVTAAAAMVVAAGAAVSRPPTRLPAPTIPAQAVVRAPAPSSPAPSSTASAPPAPPTTAGAELTSAEVGRPRPEAPRSARTWVDGVAAATGIPSPAVRAYGDATLALAADQPRCHLGWTTLAAIGNIESGHGTHGGSALDADGRAEPPIVGPALDGQGFAAIPATARSTVLHGDPRWDHAVGPLQFIPSTWWRWGADGDGDGVADPQDVDDAALAAGLYLCAGGQDLSTPTGWAAAVRSYNHSDAYVASVLESANGYAARVG